MFERAGCSTSGPAAGEWRLSPSTLSPSLAYSSYTAILSTLSRHGRPREALSCCRRASDFLPARAAHTYGIQTAPMLAFYASVSPALVALYAMCWKALSLFSTSAVVRPDAELLSCVISCCRRASAFLPARAAHAYGIKTAPLLAFYASASLALVALYAMCRKERRCLLAGEEAGGAGERVRAADRPLGLQFHHASGDLYVADAPSEGAGAQWAGREVVTTEAAGVPFNFLNGLDIDQRTSDIYFTNSSSTYRRRYPKLNQSLIVCHAQPPLLRRRARPPLLCLQLSSRSPPLALCCATRIRVCRSAYRRPHSLKKRKREERKEKRRRRKEEKNVQLTCGPYFFFKISFAD
uniref:Strictosidine synthase conserved region domain-containing protein n=1 Tax=Oryza barthii TaxID=65489 RepID=A0A0D3HSB4_9ORYZ